MTTTVSEPAGRELGNGVTVLMDAALYLPMGVLLSVLVMEIFAGGRKGSDLDKAVVVLLVFGSILFFVGGFLTFMQRSSLDQQVMVRAAGAGVLLGVASAVGAMFKQQCYLQKLMLLARARTRRRATASPPLLWPTFYYVILLGMLMAGGWVVWERPDRAALALASERGDLGNSSSLLGGRAAPAVDLDSSEDVGSSEPPAVESLAMKTAPPNPNRMTPNVVPEPLDGIPESEPIEDVIPGMEPVEHEEDAGELAGNTASEPDSMASEASLEDGPSQETDGGTPQDAGQGTVPVLASAKLDPGALRTFRGSVVPMLKDRCVSCHGADKQKGGLRLDSPQWIRKGGSSGPVVHPFQPDKSYLYTSTTLPEDDPDVMPAKGKPLTSAQTRSIQRWIRGGAPMGDGKDKKAANAALAILNRGSAGGAARAGAALKGGVEEALTAAHIQFKVVADGLLEIDCSLTRNYPEVPLNLQVLQSIAKKIHTLDLSKTKVRDADLAILGEMANLQCLLLSRTTIGDGAMPHMARLSKLEILNLYGTNVSDAGLEHLSDLTKLKKIYLWNSKATSAGGDRLNRKNPELEVNVGQ